MAITFSTDIGNVAPGLSGSTVTGVYARMERVIVNKIDAVAPDSVLWTVQYEVILHSSASARNAANEYPSWPNRLRSNTISHFTGTYDPTSDSNPHAQAYTDLKTKLAADDPPIATSIADA